MNTARVGAYDIEVTDGHIYLHPNIPPTYDYVPWNLIGAIMDEGGLEGAELIDIGANVGDSLAHFRRQSSGPVTCIEPAAHFFEILQRNVAQFIDVTLINKLLAPDALLGKVAFASTARTGDSHPLREGEQAWDGEYVTFAEVFTGRAGAFIVKTDTDGFDAQILKALLPHLEHGGVDVPIIFFEGPGKLQIPVRDFRDYEEAAHALQDLGYEILALTNIGMPYAYVGTSNQAFSALLEVLATGYERGTALCHYYDFRGLEVGELGDHQAGRTVANRDFPDDLNRLGPHAADVTPTRCPTYRALGRINFPVCSCSIACACQPAIRPTANRLNGASAGRARVRAMATRAKSILGARPVAASVSRRRSARTTGALKASSRAAARGSPSG